MQGLIRKEKPKLRKPCKRCDKMFLPGTKSTKLCDECWYEAIKNKNLYKGGCKRKCQ